MNTKYIIITVVAILAMYGAFYFGKKSAVAPEASVESQMKTELSATTTAETTNRAPSGSTQPKTATTNTATSKLVTPTILKDGSYLVSYTSTGFSPSKITIKTGKSVHFVNNSNKAMSISTTEPGSQLYGELSQSKSVGMGGTYDFTFMKAGAWTYMNRNNPADSGIIIVE